MRLLLIAFLLLAACRDGEQDRPLMFEKGRYQGSPDQPLSEDQLRRLRHRTRHQQAP